MPFDATVTFSDGTQHVYKGVPDGTAPEQVSSQAAADFKKSVVKLDGGAGPSNSLPEGLKETGRVLDKTIRGGLTALPGLMGDATLAAARSPKVLDAAGPLGASTKLAMMIPGVNEAVNNTKFGDVTRQIQTALGAASELQEPQTAKGKAIGNVGESIVSTLFGGGAGTALQKAAIGAGGGIGGEASAHLFGDNPISRILGALAGGGATAAAQAWRPGYKELIQKATSQMRPEDWNAGAVQKQMLDAMEMPHLNSQVLGPRSTLDDIVSLASGDTTARPKLISAVEKAPARAQEVAKEKLLESLPIGMNKSTEMNDVQQAATNAIKGKLEESNKAFRDAMPPTDLQYSPEHVQGLYQQLVDVAKSPKYGETTPQGKAILRFAEQLVKKEAPIGQEAVMNPTMQLRAKAAGIPLETVPGAVAGTSREFVTNAHEINNLIKGDNLRALKKDGWEGLPDKEIKTLVQAATPEFDAARQAKADFMDAAVNPTKKSLTGDIANQGGGVKPDRITARDGAISMVFGRAGNRVQAIHELGDNIGGEAVGSLLREHISNTLEAVSRRAPDTGRLEAQLNTPNKITDALAGTNEQRQNLNAALEVYAKSVGTDPEPIKKSFYNLFKAMETYKDLKISSGQSPGDAQAIASKNLPGALAQPLGTARRFFGSTATSATLNKIAEIVISPKGFEQLQEIAKHPSPERMRALAASVLEQATASDGPAPTKE